MSRQLAFKLKKHDFNQEPDIKVKDGVQENKGIVFPGFNLDVASEKTTDSFNVKKGGMLCNQNELILVEKKNSKPSKSENSASFTFKYSANKTDYFRCSLKKCA